MYKNYKLVYEKITKFYTAKDDREAIQLAQKEVVIDSIKYSVYRKLNGWEKIYDGNKSFTFSNLFPWFYK